MMDLFSSFIIFLENKKKNSFSLISMYIYIYIRICTYLYIYWLIVLEVNQISWFIRNYKTIKLLFRRLWPYHNNFENYVWYQVEISHYLIEKELITRYFVRNHVMAYLPISSCKKYIRFFLLKYYIKSFLNEFKLFCVLTYIFEK